MAVVRRTGWLAGWLAGMRAWNGKIGKRTVEPKERKKRDGGRKDMEKDPLPPCCLFSPFRYSNRVCWMFWKFSSRRLHSGHLVFALLAASSSFPQCPTSIAMTAAGSIVSGWRGEWGKDFCVLGSLLPPLGPPGNLHFRSFERRNRKGGNGES